MANTPTSLPRDADRLQCVDIVLLTLHNGRLSVLMHPREQEQEPGFGMLALPGGFVFTDQDMTLDDTVARVLRTKVNLAAPYLEQLYSFGSALRDPRGWSVSVAYYALVPEEMLSTATKAQLVPVDDLPELFLDHARIIQMAARRLRGKTTYSSLALYLVPESFTLPELQQVYEQLRGQPLDTASFRRKILEQDIIEEIPGAKRGGAHRPAKLYRRTHDTLMEFDRTI